MTGLFLITMNTMNQKLFDINYQMAKMVAVEGFADNYETLKEVFRPTSLTTKVKDAFQCMVCLDVMKPPAIFATCCKRLIACKYCLSQWIPGSCPTGITLSSINLMACCLFWWITDLLLIFCCTKMSFLVIVCSKKERYSPRRILKEIHHSASFFLPIMASFLAMSYFSKFAPYKKSIFIRTR